MASFMLLNKKEKTKEGTSLPLFLPEFKHLFRAPFLFPRSETVPEHNSFLCKNEGNAVVVAVYFHPSQIMRDGRSQSADTSR